MASVMNDNTHDWVSAHAIDEVNRLRGLLAQMTDKVSVINKMDGMAELLGLDLFADDQEAQNNKIAMNKYNKKTIYFLNVKITIWTQIIERAKNPNMLDIFNDAFNEFLQAGWEYLGQEQIELQSKEAKEEYKMFKLLLSQIPDKKKKTRRGGKKHKKNKQAAEEE
jgi:hypothetical protein